MQVTVLAGKPYELKGQISYESGVARSDPFGDVVMGRLIEPVSDNRSR